MYIILHLIIYLINFWARIFITYILMGGNWTVFLIRVNFKMPSLRLRAYYTRVMGSSVPGVIVTSQNENKKPQDHIIPTETKINHWYDVFLDHPYITIIVVIGILGIAYTVYTLQYPTNIPSPSPSSSPSVSQNIENSLDFGAELVSRQMEIIDEASALTEALNDRNVLEVRTLRGNVHSMIMSLEDFIKENFIKESSVMQVVHSQKVQDALDLMNKTMRYSIH